MNDGHFSYLLLKSLMQPLYTTYLGAREPVIPQVHSVYKQDHSLFKINNKNSKQELNERYS
uniref:Uncharacterized protein n=1 Tax=Anguilla anguilla TaxID=7936 RepID=A0A0E9SSR7_ANGAN